MIWRVMYKLLPFYFGIFLGFLTSLRPDNAWIYGFFGGVFVAVMIRQDLISGGKQ